jgi:hypothetical protein
MQTARPFTRATITLAIAVLLVILVFFGNSSTRALEPAITPAISESPLPSPEPSATPNSCWDCPGNTMTDAEIHNAICMPESLERHPQMLDYCFPDLYVWVCEPDGTCEFRTPENDIDNGADVPTTPPTPVSTATAELEPVTSTEPLPNATLTP